jgi:hypothetical protein
VSEPNRARFAADPERFAIHNKTCLVVQGAPIDPALFTVYKQRVYAFAIADCIDEFKRRPEEFVDGR